MRQQVATSLGFRWVACAATFVTGIAAAQSVAWKPMAARAFRANFRQSKIRLTSPEQRTESKFGYRQNYFGECEIPRETSSARGIESVTV